MPGIAKDAVELATRWLRLQIDLTGCRAATVESDPFVAGYLWGFCGGILATLETDSLGLFPMFSMVSRGLFGEREGPRILSNIHRVLNDPRFEAGEVAGLVDARRSVLTNRSTVGLIAHLKGGTASPRNDPDAT